MLAAGCRRHPPASAKVATSKTSVSTWPGVKFEEVVLHKYPERERLWIYTPADKHKVHPCVFVAAEGEEPFFGARLSESDQARQLPYAQAGYTVVGYDVSGEAPPPGEAVKATAAVKLFAKRDVGTLNGKAAIDFALRHLSIDPLRLYVAGHGPSGTLALQMSSIDSRIRGCVAYEPMVTRPGESPYVLDEIGVEAPEALRAIQKFSPPALASLEQCPMMLYGVEANQAAYEAAKAYCEDLKAHRHEVTLVTSDSRPGDRGATDGGSADIGIAAAEIAAGIDWMGRDRHQRK